MCGINGIFAYHYAAASVKPEELRATRDAQMQRGPDGSGEWFSSDLRLGLGHRRLAIIDLTDRAAQPMSLPSGELVVTFNGEIYNYKEIRSRLEQSGCKFKTGSDTEVLLHLYRLKGEKMLGDLRGMFAFAIWDAPKRRLFLARDPYGIKPLYYADDGWTFRFASQVKALIADAPISKTKEPAAALSFLSLGSVQEPFTQYQQIRALAPGCSMTVDAIGSHEPRSYFSIADIFSAAEEVPQTQLQEYVREALMESVRYHFVSDVPVGIFLSAGVDSGSLVGLAHRAGVRNVKTVTLGFREFENSEEDELPLAREVAKFYETDHHTRMIDEREFREDLPQILKAMDQPSIDGLNTYFISKAMREQGIKVALSGVGGDELFAGYSTFRDSRTAVPWLALPSRIPFLADIVRTTGEMLYPSQSSRAIKMKALLKFGQSVTAFYFLKRMVFPPWEAAKIMGKDHFLEASDRLDLTGKMEAALRPKPKSSYGRVAALEACQYLRNQLLRDSDWASMAHSLELRTPLVDAVLLKKLGPVFSAMDLKKGKPLLAGSPVPALPRNVLERPKTGFNLPMRSWVENQPDYDAWKNIPQLANPTCDWFRRWAYTLYQREFK